MNAKRGLTHHALSIAVADGPDDGRRRLRLRLRLRPRRGVARRRAARARSLNDVPLATPPPERRTRGRAPGDRGDRVGRPALAGRLERRLVRGRPAACARSARSPISLCQVAAARVDGDGVAVALPRGRRRRRAAHRARERRPRRLPGDGRAARRAARTSSRTRPVVAARTADGARRAATLPVGLMVDWRIAERVAGAVAGGDGRAARRCPATSTAMARARASSASSRTRGSSRAAPLPPLEAVGRQAWARREPRHACARRSSPLARARWAAGRAAAVGRRRASSAWRWAASSASWGAACSGSTSSRCSIPSAPPRLLLVAPNLREAARSFERRRGRAARVGRLPRDHPRRAVRAACRGCATHLAGMLRELLGLAQGRGRPGARCCACPAAEDLRGLWDSVRDGGLVDAVAGPERKAVIDRLQATMALIEGHAEHVMDAAGAAVLPVAAPAARRAREAPARASRRWSSCSSACSASTSRCASTSVGKRFCDAVVARRGIAGLNRAWQRSGAAADARRSSTIPRAWIAPNAAFAL